MPFFQSSEQFYACTQELFRRVQERNPNARKDLERFGLMARFNCHRPEAAIVLDGRSRPAAFSFGRNGVRPDLDITLSADALHTILLGELSLSKAVAGRALTARGPILRILALAELFRQLQAVYPQVLREQGLAHRKPADPT
jgi:hypothetical protein